MGKKRGTLRRSAAALAVALGMMAIGGTGANAASGVPDILNGVADSQALQIELQLPSTDSLNKALQELGLGAAAVLPNGLLGNKITQTISLNHGEVLRNVRNNVADHAAGFAAPLQGLIGGVDKVATRCDGADCTQARSTSGLTVKVLDPVIPGGIGTIKIAGGDSITRSIIDTRNSSRLAEVNLRLAPLFEVQGLEAVADALNTLRETINEQVLTAVNPVLSDVGDAVDGLLEGTPLEDHVTVGPIKDIPDFTKVDLLDLEVLKSHADVRPFTPKSGAGKGVTGLLATSSAKVANLDILGTGDNAWAHLGAVGLTTSSFANGVKGAAEGDADVQVVGADLGGLLGIDVPVDTLQDLTDGDAVKAVVEKLGLPDAQEGDLLAAVDLVYNIAGITINTFPVTRDVDPNGKFAYANAGTLEIIVEPKIPVPTALTNLPAGGLVPRLTEDDFVSTGLALKVTLPNANSGVSVGRVKGGRITPPPTTGVAFPLMGAVVLIGAALLVRRFALAK